MLIREISSSIHEKCEALNIGHYSLITEEYIWYLMDVYRALLARERQKQSGNLDGFYQLSCCIDVSCDRIKCGGYDSGKSIFYVKPPEIVTGVNDMGISFVGPANFGDRKRGLTDSFDIMGWDEWLSADFADWTFNRVGATIVSGYNDEDTREGTIILLRQLPTDGVKKVCVNAVFARPVNSICNDEVDEFHYPMPTDLIAKLEMLVVKDILNGMNQSIPDSINNMADIKTAIMQNTQQLQNMQDLQQQSQSQNLDG